MKGDTIARCVHCRVEVVHGSTPGSGWYHITMLQRCQSPDVPYYHLAHPDLPCPGDGPNPCLGASEDGGCSHVATSIHSRSETEAEHG